MLASVYATRSILGASVEESLTLIWGWMNTKFFWELMKGSGELREFYTLQPSRLLMLYMMALLRGGDKQEVEPSWRNRLLGISWKGVSWLLPLLSSCFLATTRQTALFPHLCHTSLCCSVVTAKGSWARVNPSCFILPQRSCHNGENLIYRPIWEVEIVVVKQFWGVS